MQKSKTQKASHRYSGLQGVFDFQQNPSSLYLNIFQLPPMRSYRIDRNLLVSAIEVKHG
jgi:hypothetical protein